MNDIFIRVRSIYEKQNHIVQVSSEYRMIDFLHEFSNLEIHFIYQLETDHFLDLNKTFNENQVVQADSFIYG